jgi:tRNA (guanine-N7-)-methyltransferase
MPSSPSRGKPLDPGHFGLTADDLPPLDDAPVDPHSWFTPASPKAHAFTRGEAPDALTPASPPSPPLELEIGSGKGTFLVQQAPLHPDRRYLGVEYARPFWKYAADRVRRHDLPNVRVLHTDAAALVRSYLPEACITRCHIYFPDPWPKARHHKRRLVAEPFLRQLHRVLEPGAHVRIATDHADYFAWMQDHAAKVADLYTRLPYEPPDAAGTNELAGTNFERKYRREGRTFHGMTLHKH